MKAIALFLSVVLGGLMGIIAGLKILEFVNPAAVQRLLQNAGL